MKKNFCKILLTILLIPIFLLASEDVPQHLSELRLLQKGVLPEDNSYVHRPADVRWKEAHGSSKYVCRTDCSGLLNALIAHSYGVKKREFRHWLGALRPKAADYAFAIKEGKGFVRISSIEKILPGDVIAMRYQVNPKTKTQNTGHVLIADSVAFLRQATPPIIPGTRQWEIDVIDSSKTGHGTQDTRFAYDRIHPGVGKGVLRLYTDEGGELVGYTASTSPISLYYSQEARELYIGRLLFHSVE